MEVWDPPTCQDSTIQTELISGRKSRSGLDAKTYWLTVSRNVTSTSSPLMIRYLDTNSSDAYFIFLLFI
jgi:hypothetical protein